MKRDIDFFCGHRGVALTKLGDLFYDLGLDAITTRLNC